MMWMPVVLGGAYRPEVEIVPTVLFPPWMLSTNQVTSLLENPLMVAWNCWVSVKVTEELRGVTATVLLWTLPTPLSATVWRLLASVSLTVMNPFLAPVACGEKLTLIVQLALGARLPAQVLACE